MLKSVYIETSIPSFYFETRPEPDMVARRDWTQFWWHGYRKNYALVTSEAVLEELRDGDYPNRDRLVSLMDGIRRLRSEEAVADIVQAYIAHKLMPRDPTGDALHLALASYHRCNFLLTWNCNHLANANKFDHIRRVNGILGLFVPALVTPLQLLDKEIEDEG